jgi:dihydrofolate reductase
MKEIIIVAAVSKNNVIGKDNKIPWYIKEDFIHFKELTTGYPIIMGKNTYLSLPKRPLPNRTNIVLTFKEDNFNEEKIFIKHSLEDAINIGHSLNDKIYIIGGAFVYKQAISLATKLEITRIDKEYQGDTYFPEIDLNIWKIIKEEKHDGYSFLTYIKKK